MSNECTHNCETCAAKGNCSSNDKTDFLEKLNGKSSVKKVIGVVSGKGGVGKSIVTALLASDMKKRGFNVGILDADITGPSIPRAFGITEKAYAVEDGIIPQKSKSGIDIMSINLLLENETDPVVWRGPVIGGTVKQFWTDVIWDNIDYLFVDMPPGTGDVPLTVFQSLPVDGIIVVTSPQDMVSMIVAKAVKMANLMNIPVWAIVENMSYITCPDCGKKIEVFGQSKLEELAKNFSVDCFARMPIDNGLATACDNGLIENSEVDYLKSVSDMIEKRGLDK